MQKILVTGGAGFIGSHFIRILLEKYPQAKVVNLDKLTYAGKLENLEAIKLNKNYSFTQGDICDETLVKKLFQENQFDTVFHFAAESHVDNSILGPKVFIETNVLGTFNLVHQAKEFWKSDFTNKRFMHVSTDEVYGYLNENDPMFVEETPYEPSSPYSASKAGADHIVLSYFRTFKMPVVVTNCSNNYGPHQDNEKLIPTVIRKALTGEPIPVYGKGLNIRDWLFVDDHCYGILSAFEKGKIGEKYNIGTNNEWKNIDLVKEICRILDKVKPKINGNYADQITFVQDRLGHDLRYGIDSSKLMNETGWKPKNTFSDSMAFTIDYYLKKYIK
jgi:dTDP-glucose 4,6-dehydratase